MNFDKEGYIKYRTKRAEETLEEAILLSETKRWNAVVNRLYYSCFYIVIALLLKKDINPSSHDGVKNQFGQQYVKTGIISKDFARLYSLLFDYRLKGDYGDMFDFGEDMVDPLINEVSLFINEIKKHI